MSMETRWVRCFFHCILAVTLEVYSADDFTSTAKTFKLSDLPVLKKWEIPKHYSTNHIGRKYKDLDNEIKRSAYWELKPDFTADELDWDDDPEKLKLDFNYKGFFDDDDDDYAEPSVNQSNGPAVGRQESRLKTQHKYVKSSRRNKTLSVHVSKTNNINIPKENEKHKNKYFSGNTNKTKKRKRSFKKSKKRSRRSITEDSDLQELAYVDELRNDQNQNGVMDERLRRSLVEESNLEHGHIMAAMRDKEILSDQVELERSRQEALSDLDELRDKRASMLDAVKNARIAREKIESKLEQKVKRHQIPTSSVVRHERESSIKHDKGKRQSIATQRPGNKISDVNKAIKNFIPSQSSKQKVHAENQLYSSKLTARTILENAKRESVGGLGDEQIKKSKYKSVKETQKDVETRQDMFPTSKLTDTARIVKPQISLVAREKQVKDEQVKDKQVKDVTGTEREKIDHPKEKSNMVIDSGNVARAVAMAMEQLKRDKMWGKVFVHVRPSGQLKVMVQETKKMDEES